MTGPARRPLTTRETEVLAHLLSVDESGEASAVVAQMRDQLPRLMVVEVWECCPSFDLAVGDEPLPDEFSPPLIVAKHHTKPYELLLFASVTGGIRTLELVHYNDDQLSEFPPAEEWQPPISAFSPFVLNALREAGDADEFNR